MGLFGKSKKSEMPMPESMAGQDGLEMPPPPVPPLNIDPDSFSRFSMPEPPQPISREKLDMARSEMAAEQEFPGLDKEWAQFAKNTSTVVTPAPQEPEVQVKVPEVEVKQPEIQPAAAPRHFAARGPIFVEMETYGEFMGVIGGLHVKLHMMDEMLARMNSLREKEDFELKRWHQSMDDMRKKLLYMDDVLFEPGR